MDPSLVAYLARAESDALAHHANALHNEAHAYTATWWQGYITALAHVKEHLLATPLDSAPPSTTPLSTTPLSVEIHGETHESHAPTQPGATPLVATPLIPLVTYTTVELMLDQGGNFARHLAQTWSVADPHNKRLLERTFAELFAKYALQPSSQAVTQPGGDAATQLGGQVASLRGS